MTDRPHPLRQLLDALPRGAAAALSRYSGISPQAISDYAARNRKGLSPEGRKLAAAAGIPLEQWYEDEPYEPPSVLPEWCRNLVDDDAAA